MTGTAAELGSTCAFTTRVSLRFLPDPPTETTDTIVLSVGEYYLDLRMDKETGSIDWGMAGTNIAENPDETPLKISFTRELDSLNEIGMVDIAKFSPLPNGDDLEEGEMPHPDLPGAPMTAFEEVWRNLPFKVGPEGDKTGISWILESDDEDLIKTAQDDEEVSVTKLFFGRIWGTYLAFQQVQTHSRQRGASGALTLKRTGSEVSARREEWNGVEWEEKYAVGPVADSVPSMKSGFEGEGKGSWRVPGEKVVIDGRSFIVRAFEEI